MLPRLLDPHGEAFETFRVFFIVVMDGLFRDEAAIGIDYIFGEQMVAHIIIGHTITNRTQLEQDIGRSVRTRDAHKYQPEATYMCQAINTN